MEKNSKILESGSIEEKIAILEKLDQTDNLEILEKMILKLDDDDIKVRGEAFSSLILNENKISSFLIKYLKSSNKNVRGFMSLVLANRNERTAIPEIIKLVTDERSMVRDCAIGALRYLKATEAKEVFLKSLFDKNLEVRKNALRTIVDFEILISNSELEEIITEKDPEIEKLLKVVKIK